MNLRSILAMTGLVLLSFDAFSDNTDYAEIKGVNFNGSNEYIFFVTDGKWRATSGGDVTCSPIYIEVNTAFKGREELLSIALSAMYAGANVQFSGTCKSDTNYFLASYIRVRK